MTPDDTTWLESERRTIRRLSSVSFASGSVAMVAYFLVRANACHGRHVHGAELEAASREVLTCVIVFVIALVTGLYTSVRRSARVAQYNATILELDPRLEGDQIPIVK